MASRPQIFPVALIRAALWVGVLLFGAVIWFLHQKGTFPTKPQPQAMIFAQVAASVIAVIVTLVLRRRAADAPDLPTRAAWTLQLWAIGEFAALFGGVLYLLSGQPQWYGVGLLSMATVFSLVPLPRQA